MADKSWKTFERRLAAFFGSSLDIYQQMRAKDET